MFCFYKSHLTVFDVSQVFLNTFSANNTKAHSNNTLYIMKINPS